MPINWLTLGDNMPNKWSIAGYLFSTATIILLISLAMNIHSYHIKEMYAGIGSTETVTVSEDCNENEDLIPAAFRCHPVKQEKYNLLAGSLFGAGFAFLCFAKSDEIKIENEPSISENQS